MLQLFNRNNSIIKVVVLIAIIGKSIEMKTGQKIGADFIRAHKSFYDYTKVGFVVDFDQIHFCSSRVWC